MKCRSVMLSSYCIVTIHGASKLETKCISIGTITCFRDSSEYPCFVDIALNAESRTTGSNLEDLVEAADSWNLPQRHTHKPRALNRF